MLTRLKKLRRRHFAIIAAVVIVAIGSVVFFYRGKTAEAPLTVPQLYQKELANLSSDLSQLSTYLDEKREISEDLNQYTTGLNNLKNSCRQMNIYHDRYKNYPLSDQVKDAVSNSRQLCTDFLQVLDYSQALFQVTGPYLTIYTQGRPPANSGEFNRYAASTAVTITSTLGGLKNIRNTVEDPAIHELTAQVVLAQGKLKQAQDAKTKNNTPAADQYMSEFVALVEQDRIDFINARAYFWRNTVGLDALQRSVQTISSSLKQ